FIGRQQLVAASHSSSNSKRTTGKTKREYVHTAYARFSPLDALTLIGSQSLQIPSPLKAAAASNQAAQISLDTLTRLQLPALLAPYQLAIVPVLSSTDL